MNSEKAVSINSFLIVIWPIITDLCKKTEHPCSVFIQVKIKVVKVNTNHKKVKQDNYWLIN